MSADVTAVIVVGGGPSGSAFAGLLARQGLDVVLLDRRRFPRPKPCGECVNPGAVAILRRLGLLDAVLRLSPSPLAGWRLGSPEGGTTVGDFPRGTVGLGIPRETLDHALLRQAAARGARVEEGVQALGVEFVPGKGPVRVRTVEADGSRGEREARLVVGADGLRSTVARALGPPDRGPRLRKLSLTCRLRGEGPPRDRGRLLLAGRTVGLAPVSADEPLWNGTVVVDAETWGREVAADASGFFSDRLREAGFAWTAPPEIVGGPWASGPFDRPRRRVSGEAVMLLGDAAGYYDPLTGQGIRRALRSAELAAGVARRALAATPAGRRVPASSLRRFDRLLARDVRGSRRVQRLVEVVVSRPSLRGPLLRRLGARPGATDALLRVTGDLAPARSLLAPGAWLPLLLPFPPTPRRTGVATIPETAEAR